MNKSAGVKNCQGANVPCDEKGKTTREVKPSCWLSGDDKQKGRKEKGNMLARKLSCRLPKRHARAYANAVLDRRKCGVMVLGPVFGCDPYMRGVASSGHSYDGRLVIVGVDCFWFDDLDLGRFRLAFVRRDRL